MVLVGHLNLNPQALNPNLKPYTVNPNPWGYFGSSQLLTLTQLDVKLREGRCKDYRLGGPPPSNSGIMGI